MTAPADTAPESRTEAFLQHQLAKRNGTTDEPKSEDVNQTPTDSTEDVAPEGDIQDDPAVQVETDATTDEGTTDDADQGEDTGPEATAPSEDGEVVEPETADLDDETVAQLAELYGDKLLSTEALQKRADAIIEARIQEQQLTLQREDAERREVANLIEKSRVASQSLAAMFDSAVAELEKAADDKEFDPSVLDAEKFEQNLNDIRDGWVTEVRGRYNRALDTAIIGSLQTLPALSDDHMKELETIISIANRMEGDQVQAPQAVNYAMANLVKFLLNRAREAGAADERERGTSKATVSKKVIEAVQNKAAAAKLAAQRGKTPPKSVPNATPEGDDNEVSEAAYRRAKAEGKHDKAQKIVNTLARRGGR